MRGSRKRGSFRRRLAGFLAACLVVTNLQGLTFAYGAEEDVIEEQAQLIQLDMSAMQSAVQDAAESGVLITAPEMAASAANAWVDLPFTKPAYELSPGNIEALLADETELPAHTSLRIFLEPLEENEEDEAEENGSYVITGDENLIFLIENDGSEAQAYQIQFGDKVTDVIVAESRKELRKELKGEDEEEEFVGGAGAVESTEAPVVESTEATAEAPTEESTEAVTEESSQAAPEESTEESSQAESEESTEAGPNAGTEESTEAENESESNAETEESSNAETEESSQAETAEPETEETTEAVTEETSPAETTPETSPEESTPAAESEGETEAETSTEAVTEATTEGTTSESTETETETEEATETVTETATEATTDSASVDSLEDAVAETEDAGNEDGGDEPVVVVEEEEEADVPEEGQVAPENESPIAALWKTTVNFLTGNITAHAAGTATPPEATETEPESESDTENQNQGNSGSNGGSGSAGGSQAEDDTDVPVATDGNADQKPGKKPEKEKVFTKADGLEGLLPLNIEWVNVLVDGGLKQANGGMFRMMMAAATDVVGGEKAVAMFKVSMSAVLAAEKEEGLFTATFYDYDIEKFNNTVLNVADYENDWTWNGLDANLKDYAFLMARNHNDTENQKSYPYNDATYTINNLSGAEGELVQGIVASEYEDGKIAFQTPGIDYMDGSIFPGYDEAENYEWIEHIIKQDVSGMFTPTQRNGYTTYEFDSDETQVRAVNRTYDRVTWREAEKRETTGFWPFNVGEINNSNPKNQYLSMHLTFDFYLNEDGTLPNKQPMMFKFTGDDDVWAFIYPKGQPDQAKLALDMGGRHGKMSSSINFQTGAVTYNTSGEGGRGNSYYVYNSNPENPGGDVRDAWNGTFTKNLYDDYDISRHAGVYTMDFYMVERCPTESNCSLELDMMVLPKSGLNVSKNLVGANESQVNSEYKFQLQRKENDEFVPYETKETGTDGSFTIKGAATKNLSVEEGIYRVVETGENSGKTVQWNGTEADKVTNGYASQPVEIVESSSDNNLICTNIFGELDPTINKSAWRDTSVKDESVYDIALEVTGDSQTTTTGSSSGANVVFVLDRSSSMSEGGSPNRWQQLVDALDASLNILKEKKNIHVSMIAFNDDAWEVFRGWKQLNGSTYTSISNYYHQLKTPQSGNTHPDVAFEKVDSVLQNAPKGAPNYVLFLTDGDPAPAGKDYLLSVAEEANAAGESLRSNYGDGLGIYMIGVGDGIKHDWWMNPQSTNVPPEHQAAQYPTAYYHSGDANLEEVFKDITEQIVNTVSIQNPKVYDTLSDHVTPTTATGVQGFDVWLYEGKLGSEEKTNGLPTFYKRKRLEAVTINGVIQYQLKGKTIAEYYANGQGKEGQENYIPPKTIVWTVAEGNLPEGVSYTLIYRVKVTDQSTNYENTGDSKSGTHEGEEGHRSNKKAQLTYNDGKTKTFNHPVVRPLPANGSITIQKTVVGGDNIPEAQDKAFAFSITLGGLTVSEFTTVKIDAAGNEVAGTEKTVKADEIPLTTSLEDGEKFQITGLNSGATYTITESNSEASVDAYYSKLTKVEVNGDEKDFENNTISGTISNTFDGSVEKKTIRKEPGNITTTYKWTHWLTPNRFVEAAANDKEAIDKAQDEVVGWLRTLLYHDVKKHGESEKYKVSGKKYLSSDREVIPTIQTQVDKDFWKFGEDTYYDVEVLKEILYNLGYQCEQDPNSGDVTYWKTGTSSVNNSANVIFTNTLTAYDKIYVEKKVETYGLNVRNEAYTFEVQKWDDTTGEYVDFTNYTVKPASVEGASQVKKLSNGSFTITGVGKVELTIKDRATDGTYRVVETDNGSADKTNWDGQTSATGTTPGEYPSQDVTNGGTVVCTNTYYNNELTIQKVLSDDSYVLENAKTFRFEVTFTGKTLTSVDVKQSAGATTTGGLAIEVGSTIQLEDGVMTFDLEAGEDNKLVLNNIPNGTSYKVEEIGWAGDNQDLAYYDTELVGIEVNETDLDLTKQKYADGSFTEDKNESHSVKFTNKIAVKTGKFTLTKNITEKDSVSNAFRFKIEKLDGSGNPEMTFYKTLKVVAGQTTESIILNLPEGTYKISEEETLKYKLESIVGGIEGTVDLKEKSVQVSVDASAASGATVTFTNRKPTDKYFTDTSVAVNTVQGTINNFHYEKDGDQSTEGDNATTQSLPPAQVASDQPKALPSNKENDDDTVE